MGSNPVPAFLTKLWTLVENPTCDDLICWDESGKSFHVFDQGRFAKEILPLYFKHSNIASFIRQLNMYGFRKVTNIEQGLKSEKDDLEFHHPYFQRGQEHLLEHIKRKITHHLPSHPPIRVDPVVSVAHNVQPEDLDRMVAEVNQVKGKQDLMNTKLDTMKRENEVLWREVASLRQKHMKQTQIINKLIQFLVHFVGANRVTGANKRKLPLMISNTESPKVPKYSKTLPLSPATYTVQTPESYNNLSNSRGPIIHDITDLHDIPTEQPATNIKKEQHPYIDISHLALPSDLVSSPTVPEHTNEKEDMNLFNGDLLSEATSEIMPKVMSISDLGRMDHAHVPTSLESKGSPAGSVSSGGSAGTLSKHLTRQKSVSEMSDHVDSVSSDLEGLKDFLTGSNYFDQNLLQGLFNADGSINTAAGDSILAGLDTMRPDEGSNSGPLVHYKPGDEDIPDLFDLAEMSKEDHEAETSKDSMDHVKSEALDTPLPIQISADDLD
ncbi:heat shock factor protein-like isoform X2 [Saccostrea echinata]|uniref:heat shock factor protein-like isoform X2 n=1 Tax=Saccostrea echinata TaxID=191078 RepID=UPI002A7FB686|nr:heat shock factor protein-like isoform X2 [Saccostrea echinata]